MKVCVFVLNNPMIPFWYCSGGDQCVSNLYDGFGWISRVYGPVDDAHAYFGPL